MIQNNSLQLAKSESNYVRCDLNDGTIAYRENNGAKK